MTAASSSTSVADWVSAISAASQAVLLPLALLFAGLQWRSAARQTERAADAADAAVYQAVAAQFQDLNSLFFENPELRPYFYNGKPRPRRGPRRGQVEVLSAMLLDFMDTTLAQSEAMHVQYAETWVSFFQRLHGSSPALQHCWRHTFDVYGPQLRAALGVPAD